MAPALSTPFFEGIEGGTQFNARTVAQNCILPYRGFLIRLRAVCRLAEYNSAIRQIQNLRYSNSRNQRRIQLMPIDLEVCATESWRFWRGWPMGRLPVRFWRDRGGILWHCRRVTIAEAIQLLEKFRAGDIDRGRVLRAFQAAPVADLGFAQVDTHRGLRKGFPEVVFGEGKSPDQVLKIARRLLDHEKRVLVTRITPGHARLLRKELKRAVYHELARCVTIDPKPLPKRAGIIAVVCAGTSDLPVAEEAALTAEIMGNRV
jgi:hypothetical protein